MLTNPSPAPYEIAGVPQDMPSVLPSVYGQPEVPLLPGDNSELPVGKYEAPGGQSEAPGGPSEAPLLLGWSDSRAVDFATADADCWSDPTAARTWTSHDTGDTKRNIMKQNETK